MTGSHDTVTPPGFWDSFAPAGSPDAIRAAANLESGVIRELTGRVGSGVVLWALEQAAQALPRIEADFSDVRDLPVRQIGAAVEAWLIEVVIALSGEDAGDVCARRLSELARGVARRELPVGRITQSMRKRQTDTVIRLLEAWPNQQLMPEDYGRLVAAVCQVCDHGISQFVEDHLDECSKLVASELTRKRDLINELAAGAWPSQVRARDIASALGFDIDRVHTAIVIDVQPHWAGSKEALERDLRSRLPDAQVLAHAENDTRATYWVTTAEEPMSQTLRLIVEILGRLTGTIRTMGEPARGLRGFRQTYAQASDLANAAPLLASSEEVMRWPDHALALTLGTDIERSRWFVRSVLGPLAQPTKKAGEQRATLSAFLASGRSIVSAAEARGVHRNTIVYRLQKLEQVIGRPLRGNVLDIECALHLVEQFGDLMLELPQAPPAHTLPELAVSAAARQS